MDNQNLPIIGKDVIESLTQGMYEDAKFIYREYIQNSADQIDVAIIKGLTKLRESAIYITIDKNNKSILFEDNATGIAQKDVQPILKNIAQSTKKRGVDKGFRGIGRLGGLAYCEKLVFETSFHGEEVKSILTWDALLLKNIINNRTVLESAGEVIQRVTSIEISNEEYEKHYFKVKLINVTNSSLLDIDKIRKYLKMVAPLPYPTDFLFRRKIYEYVRIHKLHLDEYKIYLNTEQLFKDYSTTIYKNDENTKKKDYEVIDLEFFKNHSKDGNLLYWGWYSVAERLQSLNKVNNGRGIRLRKSNIQIGDNNTLNKLHKDSRFNNYFFGEIHGEHEELLPNSRRDYFLENEIMEEFQINIQKYFSDHLYMICYKASEVHSAIKNIEKYGETVEEFKDKEFKGFTDKKEHVLLKQNLENLGKLAEKSKKKIEDLEKEFGAEQSHPIIKILNNVKNQKGKENISEITIHEFNDDKLKLRTDKFWRLDKGQQDLIAKIFIVINNILDKKMAEEVIAKIEEMIKKELNKKNPKNN